MNAPTREVCAAIRRIRARAREIDASYQLILEHKAYNNVGTALMDALEQEHYDQAVVTEWFARMCVGKPRHSIEEIRALEKVAALEANTATLADSIRGENAA